MGHPPRISRTTLACLLLFFAVANAAGKCKVGCHGMHPNKAYQEGHTYVYNLEGLSVTSVTEAQGEANLKLSATVELSAKPDCVFQLWLKNVQLNGAPPSTPDVENHAVQFNYHDGHVDTELCAEPGDSQASLNLKRAVVSLLQSAVMQESGSVTHHETDVMGACPTDFSFRKEGESLVVRKSRNLAQCAFRENTVQDLVSPATDEAAGVKNSPLLASSQEVEQRFKRGVLNKATSKEVYQLRPFSNGDAGAKTVVETTLTLTGDKADNPTAAVSEPKSLLFEAPHPVVKSSAEALGNALKAASAEVADGVKPNAANKFADLVKVLRVSTKNDILSVYQKVNAGAGFSKDDKKLLLAALFRAGSGEAAEVAVDLVKNKELTRVQELLFYTSLTLVRHVNLPSIAAVTSLLDLPNPPRLCYLGVGQVIGKYCQDHSCENVPEVKEAVHKLRGKVGNGKSNNRDDENLSIAALKALGNTQFLDDSTLLKLANIAADKNVRNRVRVAALEALPTRCSMKWKNVVFKVLADKQEDSEVRIKAYLALTACPCPHVANNVKEVLDKETVNQVGSFMQTHLRNLRASTDPNKQEAKTHLGLLKPRTKFPEDFRKFSFNNELSYKLDTLGLGSTVENNVIYSQNSYVPRSMSLNMSAEVFGRNVNFLELNTRVENLDRVLEHLFGPKGKVWEKDLKDLVKSGADSANKFGTYVKDRYEKSVRGKREVKQGELDKFAKNVQLRGTEVDESLDLDLSVKLFGVELAYLNYQSDTSKLDPKDLVDKVFDNLDKGFSLVKNLNYDLENYLQFLDAELVYPTNLGSALSLGVVGTSAVRLKTNGKFDVPAMLKDPKNAAFRVAVEPSVAVTVVGNMVVKGLGAESGMKLVTTLHTATSTDVSVSVLDGNGIDVNFGMPKKKQDLVSVRSEVLLSSGQKGNAYVSPKFGKGKEYADCFDQLSTVLGLTVCGQLSFPYENLATVQQKPLFPLSGPAKFAVRVENNDVSSFHFKVYLNTKESKKRSFEILLDTPKSKTNRRVSLLLETGLEPDTYAKVSFDSPLKKASAEVVLKNTAQERTLSAKVLHDQMEYYCKVGLLASGNKYKPVLEYKVPDHLEKLAGGKVALKDGQQYNVEGTVEVADYQSGHKFTFDKVSLVVSGQKLVVIDGSLVWTLRSLTVDADLRYGDKSLALKLDGKQDPADKKYQLSASAVPSTDPNLGFDLKWEGKTGTNLMKHKLVFVHGPDLKSEVNRLSLEQSVLFTREPHLSTSNELKYPALNLKLKFDGDITRQSFSTDVEVKYEKFKLGTEVSAKTNVEKPGDYDVELEAELMENSVKLASKRSVLDAHKSKLTNSLVLSPGGKYDADATVTYDVSTNNVNVQLDGDLNLNGKKIKVDTGLEVNPQAVNSRAFVKVDSVKYIEFLLNARKTPNPSGNLNLNLKNYLIATGQFTYLNGKGNANLNVDVPKVNRKVKATGDLVVTGSKHVGNLEVLYDAEKDPNKRVKLSTVTDLTKTSLDTKNVLEVLNNKLEVNAKSKYDDGKLELDTDVTLPNGRFLVYTLNRNSAKKDGKYDVQVKSELVDHVKKGGESRKLAYNGVAKDLDVQAQTGQAGAQLKFVDFDGKDLQVSWNGKRRLQSDKKQSELNLEVSGAKVPKKFQLQLGENKSDKGRSYKVESSLGDDLAAKASGSFELGNNLDKPNKVEGALDLKLPLEKLTNLKLEVSNNLLTPNAESDVLEHAHSLKLTYNNDKTVTTDSYLSLKGLQKAETEGLSGNGKLSLNALQLPPLKAEGKVQYNPKEEKKTANLDLSVSYGDKTATFQSNNEYGPELAVVNMNIKSSPLLEKLRNLDMQVVYKRFKKENKRTTDVTVLADGVKYTMESEVQQQDANSVFRIVSTCPAGKTELLSKFRKLGPKEYKGEWKVDTPKGFVNTDVHVKLESVEDFMINANFDSDKVKYRKVNAQLTNKPTAKSGKRVVVTVTSDGQNLVTGSTNYKKREEDGKVVVEGNGSLKVGDNTRSSSFKYTRQQLTREKDGEVGVAMVLNANFGPSAVVGELKLSNKELHVFNSYCEQNKDCAHFKLQSALDTEQKDTLKHQVTVEVDLKKFNVPAEFGLKTNTEFKNLVLDHTTNLYLHKTKDKSEYTYQLYVHPKDAATVLTLPSREMAVVLTYDLPKSKRTGAYRVDLSLYLDRKNKPSDKTSLSANGDVNVDKNSLSLSGEVKFTYPTQPKDMVVKGRLHCGGEQLLDGSLDLDVFAKKSQKVSIVANVKRQPIPDGSNVTSLVEVNSRGQQLKVDLKSHFAISTKGLGLGSFFTYNDVKQKLKTLGVLLSVDANRISTLVTLPDKQLLRGEQKLQLAGKQLKIDSELSLLDEKPDVWSLEVDLTHFKFVSNAMGDPNNGVSVNGQFVPGQVAVVNAEASLNGAKKNLFKVSVHLDEKKFLKPEFNYNKENMGEVLKKLNARGVELTKKLKDVNEYVVEQVRAEGTDFLDHLKKAQPNMKPLLTYYESELNKLKEEVNADETIKELQALWNKYLSAVVAVVAETMKQVAEGLEKLQKQVNDLLTHLKDAVKSMYPKLKESYEKLLQQCVDVLDVATKLANTYLTAVLNLVNEHQKELQDVLGVVSGVVQDFARILSKSLEQVHANLEEFYNLLVNQLKALPVYELAKEKWQQLKDLQIPEALLGPLEEVCNVVKNILPTQELRQLVEQLCQYVTKHARNEKVDDASELKKLYSSAVNALQSLLVLLQKQVTLDSVLGAVQFRQSVDFSLLSKLPDVSTLKVSLFNLLRNGELPTPLDLYYAYRPTLYLSDMVPPFSKSGVVLDGGHFFTFDGRHLTLPGTCTYVLAQDMQDGNFSVVGNFNNGNLVSVTVTEPKESITLKNNGNLLVNNKPADFPDSTKNLHAYLVQPFVSVKSDYGVRVTCSNRAPMICAVHVSGFYLGKLRGLLGDGNNEPYDDYTLPSGQITESATEFGNAYKLKPDCAAATAVEHKDRAPVCTEYFASSASLLKPCFNYVNPAQYRDACDHAVAANTPSGACLVATAYHYSCYVAGLKSSRVPPSCTSCKVGANKVDVGDTFSVKVPKKEVDVIFVVEQETPNEKVFKELVQPLMSELREELKQHGMTDVQVGLIGYSEKMKWPQHYTLNGNTNIEGEVKNMKFYEPEPIVTLQEAKEGNLEKKWTYRQQRLDVELGTFKLTDAYEEAINYPFRPGAAKAVIGVIATPCEKSPLPVSLQQLRLLLANKMYKNLGLSYYHVSHPGDLLVSGKPQKNVVGYDQDGAYTFGDSKKKPLSGNADLKNNLVPSTTDVCADFAVSSGGATFSANNFLDAKPNQKKQFVQVAARRVADDLANLELEKDCVCEYQPGIVGRSKCKIVDRKEKESAKHTKGGGKA